MPVHSFGGFMRRSNLLSLWLTLLLLVTCLPVARAQTAHAKDTAPALSKAEVKAAEKITAATLSERLHFVASDAMQGRDTPSPGLDETAHFIADNLKRWGIKPAGDDGTYFQRIPLQRTKVDTAQTHAELGERALKIGADFLPNRSASAATLDALFAGEQQTGAAVLSAAQKGEGVASFALAPQKVLHFTVNMTVDRQFTQNVVGVLEGKDKTRRHEYVALGAHYDHVGLCPPVNGDNICNGADDDGSGTVSVLTIAEALAKGPRPARSILFVWHCGEEKDLWGSKYFTEHPTVPLAQVVAQLNIDMIGRSQKAGDTNPLNRELTGPDEIYVIGSKMMSTELGDLSERVNRAFLNLAFNYKYDDPRDPNRFFFRSDHFNYAQKGIPIIFYFDGVHEYYHRPGDEPQKIDYDKMEKVARTVYMTLWAVANLPTRPKVDKPLPAQLNHRGAN